jgi:hypothetical protein
MLPTVKNNLQVESIPARFVEGALQISLCFYNAAAAGQTPALCESVNVRVYRKGRHTKSLSHYNTGCFMADARQRLQSRHVSRNCSAMLF